MTFKFFNTLIIIGLGLTLVSCGNSSAEQGSTDSADSNRAASEEATTAEKKDKSEPKTLHGLQLSAKKFDNLNIKVDSIPKKTFSDRVKANGHLEVPPQNEATVTAVVGANVTNINVIEGDKVEKGQVLAYLSHPNLAELQTRYIQAYHRFEYLKQELKRQKKLYDEEVGSGKIYQQTQADFNAKKGEVSGLESQLKQLSLSLSRLRKGELYQRVPVVSPIDGYVEKVRVQIGQYASPQKDLVSIIDNDHVHADLMVYEKDVHKVHEGQNIEFTVESAPNDTLEAEIYSVGKKFEEQPKAVHIHAEIKNKKDNLIPGMYIKAIIATSKKDHRAVPESSIVNNNGKSYIFKAEKRNNNDDSQWDFQPVQITTGATENGFTQIAFKQKVPEKARFAMNKGYYLIAELKKAENSHSH